MIHTNTFFDIFFLLNTSEDNILLAFIFIILRSV